VQEFRPGSEPTQQPGRAHNAELISVPAARTAEHTKYMKIRHKRSKPRGTLMPNVAANEA
jgi:hypothetical protein